jgi:hypothetical protein
VQLFLNKRMHKNILYIIQNTAYILWHTGPLLGNDCETNEIMAITVQELHKYATVLEPLPGSGPCTTMEVLLEAVFSMGLLQGYITQLTEFS